MKLLKIFMCTFLLLNLVNCKFDSLNLSTKSVDDKNNSIAKLLQHLSKSEDQANKTSTSEDQKELEITENKEQEHEKLSQVAQHAPNSKIEKVKSDGKPVPGDKILSSNKDIYNSYIPEVKEEIVYEILEEVIIPETKIPEITEEVIMPIPQTIDFYIEPRPISSFLTQGTSPSITSTIKSYKELAKEKINNGLNIVQKITQNIDNITENLNSKETPKEISGKEVEEKITHPIFDHITGSGNNPGQDSISNTWGEGLEIGGDSNFFTNLEEVRSSIRTKIKVSDGTEQTKDKVEIDEIIEDLQKLKEFLEKLKKYLKDTNNLSAIEESVKGLS
ncbi:ErpD protein [Borreliella burgdorferi]|uniref:ErpD protein n=1 Tax=Borreliella burgdorferi TaxID=139 RepID=UPI000BC34C57|nr:ErpD protein [Borreliella burgdorferi]ATH10749.1 ErpD protein [Borreliella burgdorferi]PRQ97572.1 ErpD protein [Borreliella burgdorferi]PRR13719.1 ErpD protein [Borreliella burgdorferi]PRR25652.1 ErpD protein [Borreliella burgdorferi]PRR35423.1 ErpD protein [Borreliella burgdorferi]